MRALFVPKSGQAPTVAELPVPVPAAGEVLLRVHAAGLNPFDNHIAAGWLEQMMEHRYPLVLGRDASGVVEAVGEGVTDIAVGDEVLAHVPFAAPFEIGTLAEYAVLPAAAVATKPGALSHIAAAAIPLAAGAAQAMIDAIHVKPGQVVLVNGASGGVGRFAVQLLAQLGVTVVATASPANVERMRELGATDVVDYTAGPVGVQVRALYADGVDALINLTGYAVEEVPLDAVRAGGTVRTVTRVPDAETLAARGMTGGDVVAAPDRDLLTVLADSAARGGLAVDIFRVVSLENAPGALADIEQGRAHGKIVVDLTMPA